MTDEPTAPTIEAHLASIAASLATLVEENTDLRVRLDTAVTRIDAQAAADLARARAEHDRTITQRWVLAAAVAVLLAVGWAAFDSRRTAADVQRVSEQNRIEIADSNRKWCPVLGAIIQPDGPPPPTKRGQTTVDLLSDLFVAYGCTPADLPK